MLLHVPNPKPSVSPNLLETWTRDVPLDQQQEKQCDAGVLVVKV